MKVSTKLNILITVVLVLLCGLTIVSVYSYRLSKELSGSRISYDQLKKSVATQSEGSSKLKICIQDATPFLYAGEGTVYQGLALEQQQNQIDACKAEYGQ